MISKSWNNKDLYITAPHGVMNYLAEKHLMI